MSPGFEKKTPRAAAIAMIRGAALFAVVALAQAWTAHAGEGDEGRSGGSGKSCIASGLEKAISTRMDIWRYHGQENFDSANHLELKVDESSGGYSGWSMGLAELGGGYRQKGHSLGMLYKALPANIPPPSILRSELESGSSGASLLGRNQSYSLDVMEGAQYITPEVRKAQEDIATRLHPDQVTFIEATAAYKQDQLERMFGRVPPHARRDEIEASLDEYVSYFARDADEPEVPSNPTYHLKVGASWLVSGQNRSRRFALPLESGDLATPVDRARYPHVWEVGRAAQTRAGAFEETLRAETYLAYLELLHAGGRLEDAYVFAHSLDAKRTRLYQAKYGMKIHSGYVGKAGESALVVPLKTLMEKQGIERFSSRVARLVSVAQGRLEPDEALRLVTEARQRVTYYLTEQAPAAGQAPIEAEVRDFSRGFYDQVDRLAADEAVRRELYRARPKIETRDYSRQSLEEGARPHHVYVLGNEEPITDFLRAHNSVELRADSLRGPEAAGKAKRLLVGAYLEYVEKLRDLGVADPAKRILQSKLRFAITSFDEATAAQVASLGEHTRWYNHRSELVAVERIGWFSGKRVLVSRAHVESSSFDAALVARWLAEDPSLAAQASPFKQDQEHYRRFMSEPELFAP